MGFHNAWQQADSRFCSPKQTMAGIRGSWPNKTQMSDHHLSDAASISPICDDGHVANTTKDSIGVHSVRHRKRPYESSLLSSNYGTPCPCRPFAAAHISRCLFWLVYLAAHDACLLAERLDTATRAASSRLRICSSIALRLQGGRLPQVIELGLGERAGL